VEGGGEERRSQEWKRSFSPSWSRGGGKGRRRWRTPYVSHRLSDDDLLSPPPPLPTTHRLQHTSHKSISLAQRLQKFEEYQVKEKEENKHV